MEQEQTLKVGQFIGSALTYIIFGLGLFMIFNAIRKRRKIKKIVLTLMISFFIFFILRVDYYLVLNILKIGMYPFFVIFLLVSNIILILLVIGLIRIWRKKDSEIIKQASEIFNNKDTLKTKQSFVEGFKKKINVKTFLMVSSLFLIGVFFYWYQLRPNSIRKSCAEEVMSGKSKNALTANSRSRINNNFRLCLTEHGLKPESLFIGN